MSQKNKFHIKPNHFRVAIFGSARLRPNDPRYNQIYSLARMIAAEGMDIVTGGGPGLMEAANKGHQEGRKSKKVRSLGLNIMLPREQHANNHLDIQKDFRIFSKRLDYFMQLSNVVVVAQGGIGTLLELMYTWQLMQVEHTCHIPIILLGDMWKPFIDWIEEWPLRKRMMDEADMHPIFLADHCREAMKIIRKANHDFIHRGPDYCWNYRKYKFED
jgi:uncharacterized protein (TIGR00725 family)